MTDKQTLLALAASCEVASGADIQLDADIRDALNLPSDYSVEWRGWGYDEAGNPIEKPKAFPYTASIDAAMTLLPDECLFTARTVWDKMKPAGLGFVSRYEKGEFGGHERLYWMDEHQALAATPALALCAAALRARAGAMA